MMNPKANATILLGYVDDISVFVCRTILCPTDQFYCLSHQLANKHFLCFWFKKKKGGAGGIIIMIFRMWAIIFFRRTSVVATSIFYTIFGHTIAAFLSSFVPTIRPLLSGCLLKPFTSGCSEMSDESRQTWMWTNSYSHGVVIQVKRLLVRLQ